MLFSGRADMGVSMKYMKMKNVIRLVAILALAASVTRGSTGAQQGETGTSHASATAGSIHVMEADAVAGGQAVESILCATLVLSSPFFPIAIIPAIPICYHAFVSPLW